MPNLENDAEIVDYLLGIDAMTTSEFCKEFDYPIPYYTGNIKTTAAKFLEIDAFKWHKVMEFAKAIRRKEVCNG